MEDLNSITAVSTEIPEEYGKADLPESYDLMQKVCKAVEKELENGPYHEDDWYWFKTQEELGEWVGVTKKAVSKWNKEEDWIRREPRDGKNYWLLNKTHPDVQSKLNKMDGKTSDENV